MREQLLVDMILDRLPVSTFGIIFISVVQGGSVSKIEHYVN
ncbi:MAG: hypothetical protein ACOYVK_02240 [Bacillota bacterium]